MITDIRISIRNTSDTGGTALTPFFAAFHDNSFDIYDLGAPASAGLEALAEDGNNAVIAAELSVADADAQSINVAGAQGPLDTRELASTVLGVDGASNGYFATASMLLPSNDAFVGTANALQLFDAGGAFLGAQVITFDGASVRDAGTEVNTETDAAFLNQTAPNTGDTEGGVVTVHPGFNGSLGNPGGTQNILGGTNAFGNTIDPIAADFTQPGAEVAVIHVNVVNTLQGSNSSDLLLPTAADDIVDAGLGRDFVVTGAGWDEVDGGAGGDVIKLGRGDDIGRGGNGADLIVGADGRDDLYGDLGRDKLLGGRGDDNLHGGVGTDLLIGGSGNDALSGDEGGDRLLGGDGNDQLDGGAGGDLVNGGDGEDIVGGGAGRDRLIGGSGNDVFVFGAGYGRDTIVDFEDGADTILLAIDGIASFDDVLHSARDTLTGLDLKFDGGDILSLRGVDIAALSADDFSFA